MFGTLARHAAAAIAAFFVGTGADAKPSTPAPPKPVNEAARLEGEKLIAVTGAPDLFLNETRDGAILIRHKASNFQCLFNPGGENALMVDEPHGDEIGCDGPTMLFHTTYFIKRAGQEDSLDASYEHAVEEVKARWPKAMNI